MVLHNNCKREIIINNLFSYVYIFYVCKTENHCANVQRGMKKRHLFIYLVIYLFIYLAVYLGYLFIYLLAFSIVIAILNNNWYRILRISALLTQLSGKKF